MAGPVSPQWGLWDWLEWLPDCKPGSRTGKWVPTHGVGAASTKEYLGLGRADVPVLERPGVHICFLPRVKQLREDGLDLPMTSMGSLRKHLSNIFYVPHVFWRHTGQEGNGYFWARPGRKPDTFATAARFLVKEVQADTTGLNYDWLFFGLVTFWSPVVQGHGAGRRSTVLLCFDMTDEKGVVETRIMSEIATMLMQHNDVEPLQCSPFGIYVMIMEPLLEIFDDALWGFRKPVRNIESNRLTKTPDTNAKYIEMHELWRHIIHAAETLDAAAKTLDRIVECNKWFVSRSASLERSNRSSRRRYHRSRSASPQAVPGSGPYEQAEALDEQLYHTTSLMRSGKRLHATGHDTESPRSFDPAPEHAMDNIGEDLHFYSHFFAALQLRAQAFEERMNNEVELEHHRVQADVLREMRSDSKEVATLVTYATILFLPGTFVAGFFGMNVITFSPPEKQPMNGTSSNGTAGETTKYYERDGWQVSYWMWLPFGIMVFLTTLFLILALWRPWKPRPKKDRQIHTGTLATPTTTGANAAAVITNGTHNANDVAITSDAADRTKDSRSVLTRLRRTRRGQQNGDIELGPITKTS